MDESEAKKSRSQTLQECYVKQMKYLPSNGRQQKFDRTVILFLIEGMHPLGAVDGKCRDLMCIQGVCL